MTTDKFTMLNNFGRFYDEKDLTDSILSGMSDGLYFISLARQILFWNDSTEKITGFSSKEAAGCYCFDNILDFRYSGGGYECDRVCPLNEVLKEGRTVSYDAEIKSRNGSVISVSAVLTPVKNSAGEIIGAVKIFRDITNEVKLAETKRNLIDMIIHDFNNSLQIIQGNVDLILKRVTPEQNHNFRGFKGMIKNRVRYLSDMIGNLIEVDKMESDGMVLDKRPLNYAEFAAAASGDMADLISSQGKIFIVNAADNLPEIEIDGRLIRRVILNLLHNAQKFTKEGASISMNIYFSGEERGVVTEIKDSGPGIREEDQRKLFEKFSQLDAGAVQGEKGFGLGLAFCRMAVSAHGGRIWLKSAPGQGSSFFFILPAGGPA